MPERNYYWDTYMHPNCIAGRLERLYNEDGSPKLDTNGTPRTFYTSKLRDMTTHELWGETKLQIWADWYRHPDADWKCGCCYDETLDRTKSDKFYGDAHASAEREERGY